MNIKNWIYILFFNISCSGLLFGMDPSLYQSSLSQSSLSQSSLPKSPFEQSEREGSIRGFSASQGNVPTKTWATSMLESAYNTIFSPQKTSGLPISTFYEEESDRSRQKAFSFDTFQTLVFNITDKDLYKVITFPSFKRNEIIGIVKKNLTILQDYIKEYHKPESARINYLEEVKTDIDALGKKIQDQSIDLKERLEEIASFRNKILAVSFVTQESDLAASFIDLATSGSLQTSTIAIKNEVRALENQWPDDVGGRILYIFGKQDWSDDIKEAILQLLFFEYSNVKLGRKEKEEAKTREIKIAQGIDQPAPPTAAISLALEALNKQAAAIIANPGEPKQLVGLEGFIEKVANLPDEQASGLKEWFNNFIEKQGKGLPTIKEVIAALQAKKTMQEEQLKREKEEREIGVEASDFSELETAFIGSDEPSASIPLPILELKDKYLLNAYKLIYDYEINKAQDKLEAAIKLWYQNRASGRFTPDAHHMQLPLAQYSSNTKQIKEDIARDYSNQFVGRNKKLYQEISKLIILLLENSSPDKQELVKADIISLVDYLNPGHQGFNSTRESIKFLVRKINQNNIEDITKACFVLLSDILEFQPIINNINRMAYTKNRDALYGLGLKKSLNDKEEKDFNGLIKNLNDIYNYSNLAFELRKQQQLHIGASKISDVELRVVQDPLLEEGQSSIQPTEWKMEVRRSTSGLPEQETPQKTTKKQSGSEIISSLTQVPKDLPATNPIPEIKKEEEQPKLEQELKKPFVEVSLRHDPERNLVKEQKQFKQELEDHFLGDRSISKALRNIAIPLYKLYEIPLDADFNNIKMRQEMIKLVNDLAEGIRNYVRSHGSPSESVFKDYIDSIAQHPLLIKLTNPNPQEIFDYTKWRQLMLGEGTNFRLSCINIHQYFPNFPTVPLAQYELRKEEQSTPMPSDIDTPKPQEEVPQPSADDLLRLMEKTQMLEPVLGIDSTASGIGPSISTVTGQDIPTEQSQPAATPEEQPTGWISWLWNWITSFLW